MAKKLNWEDRNEIVDILIEKHADTDPKTLMFTDLRSMILNLEEFIGAPSDCYEGALEAIQAIWIEEVS